jgi:hypothetical protein
MSLDLPIWFWILLVGLVGITWWARGIYDNRNGNS